MENEKRLVYDSEFKWRINAIIRNRKRMGLPYDQLESVALGLIDLCPTVDAVEVVRCRDCEFTCPGNNGIICTCWGREVDSNGFCYLGERKDNGD